MVVKSSRCCWYHKGTNFQANHNYFLANILGTLVVADTTKVRIFKQITTAAINGEQVHELLLIPQRYEFSSKSQHLNMMLLVMDSCCWYHKGTNFQANHNKVRTTTCCRQVVADTTKVRIFKQITTRTKGLPFQICCCWYHKGTNFQANHNKNKMSYLMSKVVADTTKVRIFKQITT